MQKVIITGGAGFVGSAVIRYLLTETNCYVLNIDKLTYAGNLDTLSNFVNHNRYKFIQCDICDKKKINDIFNKFLPDSIIHLAAESHVDRSIDSPGEFIQTNIVGTYVLLQAAHEYLLKFDKNKQKSFRFLHVSTDEVYGELPHPDDYEKAASQLFSETSPYRPSTPYAASKAGSDHLVRAWARTFDLPILITNCSNNYGPFQFPEKFLPVIITNALAGKELPVYGDGDQIRDWLYVDDHARALYTVLNDGIIGETYNVGGHNEKKNIEVVEMICEILNDLVPPIKNFNIKSYNELIRYVPDRPGHDRRYAIDASKIEKELDWYPAESLESGILKTIKWYIGNQEWCEKVRDGSYRRIGLGKTKETRRSL